MLHLCSVCLQGLVMKYLYIRLMNILELTGLLCFQSDLDDALNAQHAAEENAHRLANENGRLADELRQEQVSLVLSLG